MKHFSELWVAATIVALTGAGAFTAFSAVETNSPATLQSVDTNGLPQSVFTIPGNPKQGRDPFFPSSTRLMASTTQPMQMAPTRSDVIVELQGISGTADRRMALIFCRGGGDVEKIYRTMAAGEETEFRTIAGRVRVRCLEIKAESVIVDVGGERRELRNPRVTH